DTRNVNPTMLSMAIKISRPTNVRRLSGGRTSSAPTPHVRTRGAGRRGRAWRGPDRAAAHSPGRVERERPVRPVGVVVGGESGEHRSQVLLAEDDQVVAARPASGPDQPFGDALACGARTGVRMLRIPRPAVRAGKSDP